MSSSPSVCGICDMGHISKPSEVWCLDCEEGLCVECIEYHSLVKLSRGHTTIPISGYQKLPSYVVEIKEHCNEHHEKFNLYCKAHECPCCGICMVETHRDCVDISILGNIVKDVKTPDLFNGIEQLISEMIETIGQIRQNREDNTNAVRQQKIIIENEIREVRTKINNHLDKLQESLMKELTEAENLKTEETRELLASLDKKQKELTEYQTNIVSINKYASDLQTYIAVKRIEKHVETHDTCLQAIVNSDCLAQSKISYKIDTGLKTITSNIQNFGAVVIESKPSWLTFFRKKNKQAQMMVADLSPPISVENIQLNLKLKLYKKGRSVKGCSFLPEGKMVFSCYSTNTVRIFTKDGVELFQMCKEKTGSDTYDTVYMKDNNSVAVSSGGGSNRCITIIDVVSQEVMTTISMDTNIYGMAVRGRTIYYCTGNKGLKMINLSDKSVSDIIQNNMSNVYYVATFRNKLYYANGDTHTVTCCDLHGTTQWEFKDTRVQQYPYSISIDKDGNVYVVGYDSNNVVVISPDGQRHRQLLFSKDGLKKPRLLEYDRSTNS